MCRTFIPITIGIKEAGRTLNRVGKPGRAGAQEIVGEVRDILLGADLTPLQAQAVLVRAWAQVQLLADDRFYGELSKKHSS